MTKRRKALRQSKKLNEPARATSISSSSSSSSQMGIQASPPPPNRGIQPLPPELEGNPRSNRSPSPRLTPPLARPPLSPAASAQGTLRPETPPVSLPLPRPLTPRSETEASSLTYPPSEQFPPLHHQATPPDLSELRDVLLKQADLTTRMEKAMRDQESKLLELGERLRLQAISDSQRAEERLALLLANQIQEKEARLMRAISSEVEVQANRHPSFPKDRARPTKKPSERAKEKGPDATGAEEFDPIREAFALFLNSDPSQHQLEAMWPSFDAWVLSTATQNGFGAIDLPDIFPKSRWLAWFPADDPSSWDDHRPSQTVQPRASLRSTSIQNQYFHQAAVPGPPQTYEYSHPPPQNNNIHSPSYPGDNSPPGSDGT